MDTEKDQKFSEVVRALEVGDFHGAFSLLYSQYAALMLAFLKTKGLNATERDNLSQEIWMKVWIALPDRFDPAKSKTTDFRGLMYTIARNTVIDFFRKSGRDKVQTASDVFSQVENHSTTGIEGQEDMHKCLKELKQRNEGFFGVVQLWMQGYILREIAEKLSIPEKTSQSRFTRSKAWLKKCLERNFNED